MYKSLALTTDEVRRLYLEAVEANAAHLFCEIIGITQSRLNSIIAEKGFSFKEAAAKERQPRAKAKAIDIPMLRKRYEDIVIIYRQKLTQLSTLLEEPALSLEALTKKKDEVTDAVCSSLQNGASFDVACLYANTSPEAMRELMESDKSIAHRVQRAEATFTLYCTQKIMQKTDRNWKAYAWMLERRQPQFYGEVDKFQNPRRVTTKPETALSGGSVAGTGKDWSKVPDEELFND